MKSVTEFGGIPGRCGGETRDVGEDIYGLVARLYPLNRCITGNGVRETLEIIGESIPLEVHEVPTGTKVFDWTIPKEWNVRDAYVEDHRGVRVIDFRKSNLHLVAYSIPVRKRMLFSELKNHLHTLPDHPDWTPHKTSYYQETWGFCLRHRDYLALPEGEYEVCIDSTLEDGSLTYGECFLPGETSDEVLISCHVCHPSLCNDNLSGISLAAFLAKHLALCKRRYSYRLLFLPTTIGSITWLARNESRVGAIKHGIVLTCVGDDGGFTYKKSRRGNAEIDRVCIHVLKHRDRQYEIRDFYPFGYDERQYCSPGFNLPVGLLMRTAHGCFPEYHTSADNLEFVTPAALAESFSCCRDILDVLERNFVCKNTNPKCEPQLGRRGMFRSSGGRADASINEHALLWVLNLSDGAHSLLDIAERAELPFENICRAADALQECGLLEKPET